MDYSHHHQVESKVKTNVTYNDGEIFNELKDNRGTAPELNMVHEAGMHFIIVSNDLEEYYHLHPEQEQEGNYAVSQALNAGTYQAFVDITPVNKAYQITSNPVQVGTSKTDKASQDREDNWTKKWMEKPSL